MPLALTVTDRWHDGKRTHLIGKITPSGNYTTGGDTLDLLESLSQNPPKFVTIEGVGVYQYQYVEGTLSTNGKVIVRTPADGAQVAQAAYDAAVIADVIKLHAIFDTLQ